MFFWESLKFSKSALLEIKECGRRCETNGTLRYACEFRNLSERKSDLLGLYI